MWLFDIGSFLYIIGFLNMVWFLIKGNRATVFVCVILEIIGGLIIEFNFEAYNNGGDPVTSKTYYAVSGMTWGQFLDSVYLNDNYNYFYSTKNGIALQD